MDFGLSSDQILLKDTLRRYLETECPTTRVRQVMESDTGHDTSLWAGLVELGVAGLTVPVEHGGSGLELLDLALASEELGYAATPGPFLGNAIAAVALQQAGKGGDWLARIAAGNAIGTIAIGEEDGEWSPPKLRSAVERGKLNGVKPLVPYAAESDVFVVAAREAGAPGLWLVERSAAGLSMTPVQGIDGTRRVHTVRFDDVAATRLGGEELAWRALDAGLVLVAADAYGGARRCLDMTVKYALQREQFGQLIGSFQAVKHQLANLAAELEPALSLWWYAAHAFDHMRDQASRHAAIAKAHLADVYDRVTRDTTELHGGIGFTWEYDLHLWFRRAMFDRAFLGESSFWRGRAADLAGW